MTALAPSIYAPSLVRSDLLKLRKRRSLSVVVGLLTIIMVSTSFVLFRGFDLPSIPVPWPLLAEALRFPTFIGTYGFVRLLRYP